MSKSTILLTAILFLALGIRIPGFFTQDYKTKFQIFEPDEFQHVEIAVSLHQGLDSSLHAGWDLTGAIYNVQGMGIQVGWITYFVHRAFGVAPSADAITMAGRMLACLFSLLCIGVVYQLALLVKWNQHIALSCALFLCLFDLNVTYSHYFLPESAHVFCAYAAVYYLLKVESRPAKIVDYLLLALCLAGCLIYKFDFLPFLVFLLSWVLHKKFLRASGWVTLMAVAALTILSFFILTTFQFSWVEIKHSFVTLAEKNRNVVARDQHWLHNPLLYLLAVVAGIGVPASVLATLYVGRTITRNFKKPDIKLIILLAFVLLEFTVLWAMDTPFVRRANVFLPICAMAAAAGLYRFIGAPAGAKMVAIFAYTLLLTLISQSNFWNDTRYQARDFIQQQQMVDKAIHYGPYALAKGMPRREKTVPIAEAEILILQESFYGRYWKYFTTPFKRPVCCEEVYHCLSEEICLEYQGLLSGQDPRFEQIKLFPTREYLPERLLFKRLFGTYESFLGDTRIFQRKQAGN